MQKRGIRLVLTSLIILFLASSIVNAQPTTGGGGEAEQEEFSQSEIDTQTFDDVLNGRAQSGSVSGATSGSGGGFSSVTGWGEVTNNGKTMFIAHVSTGTTSDGVIISDAQDVEIERDGDYNIGQVSTLQQGALVITNGVNVHYSDGILTADHA